MEDERFMYGGNASASQESQSTTNVGFDYNEEKKEMDPVSAAAETSTTSLKQTGYESSSHSKRRSKEQRDDLPRREPIKDEQVHVNLAMADLMAYLQVVANNSNHLPMTRRDDPEIGRMVSTLTNEEYSRKSAAFIPADVRVIGGSFTKYGRVWDLPTSGEYNAQDGAQEPGRSYGGACSNAILKVLYDAANEMSDAGDNGGASDNLFDDDEDEENTLASGPAFGRSTTFASIEANDQFNGSTITWADLLRKMKAEMKDIEYPQVPSLSATRKFDVNQPFSLVPKSFDPATGKRRSLLIGCNYQNINGAQLKASHDDVRSIKDYIVNVHGFPEDDETMTILLDDDDHKEPTFMNITEAFKALSEQSQPGDAVFIHFSGHGGRVLGSGEDAESESYDEVIVPTDYSRSGLIRDTLIFKTLLAPMRYGVTVTVLIDACDTGMMLDLPYSWSTRTDRAGSTAKMTPNDDFSFVRFLKVVKTLYESSTFTQLGKTVGSALNPGNAQLETDDDATETDMSKDTRPEGEELSRSDQQVSPLMRMFGVCGSNEDIYENEKESRRGNGDDQESMTLERPAPSIFEQMLNCTLGQEVDDVDDVDDVSFSKSHGTRSFSEPDLEDSTFDSYEEDYRASKRGRGRSRRRRK